MSVTILHGDWVEQLRTLPDNSVHCSVTSPPYFGLRNYGVEGQAGLEKTPEDYIAGMVAGFRELRRVLRGDGVLWLNLGDSYATNGGAHKVGSYDGGVGRAMSVGQPRSAPQGLKPKDLIGIPHRVAFALQADGWYLRAICPWIKRNGMPESCRDRPTQTIEYIFLLTKSPNYFYDAEAVKMKGVIPAGTRGAKGSVDRAAEDGVNARPPEYKVYDGTRLRRSSDWFFESLYSDEEGEPLAFVVNTKPYKGAHFATFPPKLIEPMILAGTSEHGCCSACGAPWERTIAKTDIPDPSYKGSAFDQGKTGARDGGDRTQQGNRFLKITVGWQPTCKCNADLVPCTVLDPFGGSGTTGAVTKQHGRNAVLIELNPAYTPLINARCE